jgi:FixJ family two-component response regulator
MTRHCAVCDHPQRHVIERAIVARTPFRQIAASYEMSHMSVWRHRDHLAETLARHIRLQRLEAMVAGEALPPLFRRG